MRKGDSQAERHLEGREDRQYLRSPHDATQPPGVLTVMEMQRLSRRLPFLQYLEYTRRKASSSMVVFGCIRAISGHWSHYFSTGVKWLASDALGSSRHHGRRAEKRWRAWNTLANMRSTGRCTAFGPQSHGRGRSTSM
jgi:hypothetical protein